jgi:hypothetical protein
LLCRKQWEDIMEVNSTSLLKVFIGAGAAVGLLCATAQGQTDPLVTGNNAAFGNGPIATTTFPAGPTVDFIPDGAKPSFNNGRGLLVLFSNLGNNIYYTELTGANSFGPTDKIRIAPFNGGHGGADIGSLPNPRPLCGVQDLAYANGFIYALTGYPTHAGCTTLEVFKIPLGGTTWSAPVTISGPPSDADGFTILVNNNGAVTFIINKGDENGVPSCTYGEFNSTTGAPTGKGFVLSGFAFCSGIDTSDSATDGTHVLYFSVGPTIVRANEIHSATLSPSFTLTGPSTTFTPGDGWGAVNTTMEDISLVHTFRFAGTPGAANCHGQSVSVLSQTYGDSLANAAAALGYASVKDLQAAITAFCGG